MRTYDFTLRLDREVTAEEVEALYGVFDDGSITTGPGITTVEFTLESRSWSGAVGTATRDIEGTVSSLRVIGVEPEEADDSSRWAAEAGRAFLAALNDEW